MLNQLRTELENLEKYDIIEKISVPTEWVHPIVIVRKTNIEIRI